MPDVFYFQTVFKTPKSCNKMRIYSISLGLKDCKAIAIAKAIDMTMRERCMTTEAPIPVYDAAHHDPIKRQVGLYEVNRLVRGTMRGLGVPSS